MSHLMQPNSGSQQMTSSMTPSMGGQQQIQQQLQQQPIMGQSSQPQAISTTNTVQSMPTQSQQSNTEQRYDLIARVRALVWSLKESLANLMRVAASNIQHNSQIDSGLKTSEEKVLRFDKALEDFFSICNQIELHLKTILECAIQARDSQSYLPFAVSPVKTDNVVDPTNNMGDNQISYNQYLITIKSQVNFAKTVHDMLIEGAKRINQFDLPINPIISSTTPASNTAPGV